MHEMAPIICILLFVFAFDLEIAQPTPPSKTISSGLSLSPNGKTSYWPSPSGHFAFGFYKEGQGFRVGIWLSDTSSKSNKIVVVWTANRDDLPVSANATLVLTHDGELELKTQDGQAQLIEQLSLSNSIIHHASMDDNGNFLLYRSDSKIIWQSFDYPTDTILGGQTVNCSLYSGVSGIDHSGGKFVLDFRGYTLVLRRDLYPRDDSDIYWISHEYDGDGDEDIKLILNDNGRMYLATEKGEIMENFTYGCPFGRETLVIYRATLDSDGMFRLYSHSIQENGSFAMEVKWKEPKDKCSVTGICGFNSYCKLVGDQTDCMCLPGFNYTNLSDRSEGCYMRPWVNHGFGSIITTLENTTFDLDFYSYSAESGDKERCMEACRKDDFCVVALFKSYCYKLKLPLRYGCRNDQTISDVLFVKSASGNWSTENSTCSTSSSLFKISVILLVVGVIFAICSCITMAVLGYLFSRRGLWKHTTTSEGKLDSTEDIVLRSFSYNELAAATNGFSEVLGRGHFGTVYKGSLTDNERNIAVKKLGKVVEEGEREFQMETRAIGRTHHKNLVHLIGFCNEGFNRLLVYDYMRNGSLADFLFQTESRPSLSDRMRIILEVARGILYLHEDCEPHIIHCDIKPHNILLDEFWTAKISDFGMAKLLMPNQTRTFTGPRGTRGYLAPEWYQNKPISVKADVYSFGIVLLETIFCRKNIELQVDDNEIILTDWIYKCYEAGELSKLLLDTEEVEKRQMERIIKVGLCCIQGEPDPRPSMKNVIWMIEGLMDVHVPPLPTS